MTDFQPAGTGAPRRHAETSKSTIWAIDQSGRMSAARTDDGGSSIHRAESFTLTLSFLRSVPGTSPTGRDGTAAGSTGSDMGGSRSAETAALERGKDRLSV